MVHSSIMTPPRSLGSGLLGEGKANRDVWDQLLRVDVPPHVQAVLPLGAAGARRWEQPERGGGLMGRGPGSLYPDGLASSRSLLGAYSETSYGWGGGRSPSLWVQVCGPGRMKVAICIRAPSSAFSVVLDPRCLTVFSEPFGLS